MPEIFKIQFSKTSLHKNKTVSESKGRSQFLLSRNNAYWDLAADQNVTDGFFSGDTRLIVTRSSEQNDKNELELITRVISLK